MRLRRLDLNLLVVLDTLLAEQSVTRAAVKLHLTQSAVSHALRRLRAEFDDPLLVRGPRGMELTWRASDIRAGLRGALNGLEQVLSAQAAFDPATSSRSFGLRVSDYVSDRLLAQVCCTLRDYAPGVMLNVRHFAEPGTEGDDDDIHVCLSTGTDDTAEFRRLRVLDDTYAVLMRAGHPCAAAPMTLDSYLGLRHAKVSASAIGGNMIDDALVRRGLSRRVVVQLPSWSHVAPIVDATDLVAAIPRHWAAHPSYAQRFCYKLLPLEEVSFSIDVVWDRCFDDDPGHRWMRKVIVGAMRDQVALK